MPVFNTEDIHEVKDIKQTNNKFTNFFKVIFTFIIVFAIGFGGSLAFSLGSNSSKIFEAEESTCDNFICNIQNTFGKTIQSVISDVNLKGQSQDRTNILILGLDAEYGNTDTIIVASLFHKTKKIVTFSLPRDIYVKDGINNEKINGIYPINENIKKGSGVKSMAKLLQSEYDLPIHYWATIKFEGVEKIVDSLGGISVNVENEFQDCEFPNKNYGYLPCQSFEAGSQEMNGKEALIYARSRKGNNGEGSDFARSRRQSIVIQSIINKFKTQNFFDVGKLNSILGALGDTVKLGMESGDLKSIINFVKKIDTKNDILKYNFAVDDIDLCQNTDDLRGYYIYYCDGADSTGTFAGSRKYSPSRENIKAIITNPIAEITKKELLKKSILVVGNQSDSVLEIQKIFTGAGFTDFTINNYSKQKKPAGKVENVIFYVDSEALKTQLESIDFGFTFQPTIIFSQPKVQLNTPTIPNIVIEVD
jgi:polyisoprenyl-teichoic acid--peptidoglycan teichoic acid transferase